MISKTLFNQRLEWRMKLEKENQNSFYQKKKTHQTHLDQSLFLFQATFYIPES